MKLTHLDLINNNLVNHTKNTINDTENLTFYIDQSTGWNNLDRYTQLPNGDITYVDTLRTYNIGHNQDEQEFIRNVFIKLDKIIDLDFSEMLHNNGSLIDIYHVDYSSNFQDNTVGEAITQRTTEGSWWDIFWRENPIDANKDVNDSLNTIIHEIGHSLGLGHPFNDPFNKEFNSKDTIMSYNKNPEGWDKWFSKNDLDALIYLWGRENDMGSVNYEKNSIDYKYKQTLSDELYIETEIGLENITDFQILNFLDTSLYVVNDIKGIFDSMSNIDSIPSKIYRLYNAGFGRFPDKDGFDYWIEKNTSNIDTYKKTAQSFILSDEFNNLYPSDSDNEQYITSLYLNVLDREPDIVGSQYWLNQIEMGFETKAELLMGFAESNENKTIFSAETSIY